MVKRERLFRVFALPDDQSIIKDHRFFARFLKVMQRMFKINRGAGYQLPLLDEAPLA
jgi:hypothetical protein